MTDQINEEYDDEPEDDYLGFPMVEEDFIEINWNQNFTVNKKEQWVNTKVHLAARPGVNIIDLFAEAEKVVKVENIILTNEIAEIIDAQRDAALEALKQQQTTTVKEIN